MYLGIWKIYCEWLYQDSGAPGINQLVPTVEVTGEDELNIQLDEVRETVDAMKKRKAFGCDDI